MRISPGLAIIGTAIVVLTMGSGLHRVEIDASIGTMLIADDPAHDAHEQYTRWFGSDEVLSVAIPFEDALSIDALILQKKVVEDLEKLEGVTQVTALVTQDDPVGRGDELTVAPLIPEDIRGAFADDSKLEALRFRVLAHPVWKGWLVSKNIDTVAIQVRLDDSREGELERAATMEAIDAVLTGALGSPGFYLAGHPFMKSEITRSIASDLARLLPIAFLVMSALLLVVTRSLFVGAVTAISVLLSVLLMVGAMGWLGLGMTALTNTAPTILVALSTACFLHLTAAFQSADERSAIQASQSAIALVRRPMWIACMTTAVGYASLYFSSVPIVSEFGLTLAIGMIGTGVVGSIFLPAMLALSPDRRSDSRFAEGFGLETTLSWVSRMVARFPAVIVLVAICLGTLMSLVATQIQVDSSGPQRFEEDSRFRISSDYYRSNLSGDVLESVYLRGAPGDFLQPEVLRAIQAFQDEALRLPQIDKVVSIADYVARTYWVFRGEADDPRLIPDSSEAVAQLLLLRESSGDLGDIADYISPDYSMIRIFLSADVQSSSVSAQIQGDLYAIADKLLPEYTSEHSVVSTEMLLSQAADVISVEQVRSAGLALMIILVVISLSFGTWRAGGMVVLPNALPLVMNLGFMSLAGFALSDATSIISATALGIAVDSTVHILNEIYRQEKNGASRKDAVHKAIQTTGRPVVVTSLIVIIGFLILMFSEFGSIVELGTLTALTMFYCLIGDLFVLPAQMLTLNKAES